MLSCFITSLKKKGIKLWVNEDKIGLFIPEDSFLLEEEKQVIKQKKDQILEVLKSNEIFSKDDSDSKILAFHDDEQSTLSFAQERLWFIQQYENGTSAYNVPMMLKLNDSVDIQAVKESLVIIVNRHDVLRTVFKKDEEEKDYQVMINDPLLMHEIEVDKKSLNEQLANDANYLFDLNNELPIRIVFYKVKLTTYVLITIHHLAFDGLSMNIFLNELNAFYLHFAQGADLALPEVKIQYKDFARWQKDYLTNDFLDQQISYWKENLTGYQPVNLLTDKKRPKLIDYNGENISFFFGENLSSKLRALAKTQGVTLYTLLLSGFYVLLSKYTGQQDIVVGTPIANRQHAQLDSLIGFFVNSLALRAKLSDEQTFEELISQVQENMINAQNHQDMPFEKLVDALKVEQDSSRHPIFQILFAMQNFGGEESLLYEMLPQEAYYKKAKFDLSMLIDDKNFQLKGVINYATSLFEKNTIERLARHYITVLEVVADNKGSVIDKINLLDEEEYDLTVKTWNKKDQVVHDKTIVQLFEEQAEMFPDSIAIVFEEKSLTYKQLNEKTNQLARYLRDQYQLFTGNELNPDALIAICLERSLETIIYLLAILKAGAAYVPMDPDYPEERIQFILEDANSPLLITQNTVAEKISAVSRKVKKIFIEEVFVDHNDMSNLKVNISPHHLAYVIYTSGTTGKPKGVLQIHANVVRLFASTQNEYQFNHNDVWTLFHSYVFDFTVWELWGALFFGGKLIIPSYEETRDTSRFYELCDKHEITVLNQTPLAFYRFIEEAMSKKQKLDALRCVIFGGDALNIEQLKPWWNKYGSTKPKLINMYGITETTVHVTYKELSESDVGKGSLIGKAIKDLKVYVLDNKLRPLPIGVVGELYVGGAGLARGYLNQPKLTEEKFIDNPFTTEEDRANGYTRLYKTGDLVRWHEDGELEYIGRNDFQIKLRGFRIELGEIDNVLAGFHCIKQCTTVLQEGAGSQYLVGYYTADKKADELAIKAYLLKNLPEYMVPTALVYLEKMPLTINGKLDRKALPKHDFTLNKQQILPRDEVEVELCKIWSEVLRLESIGIQDDFFRMGGDSILSIQLASRLRNKGYNCSIKSIFENRTVEHLSHYLKSQLVTAAEVEVETGILSGEFDLLPIQKWFFEKNFQNKNYYNQSFLIKVPALDLMKLKQAINQLVEQHDALRLSYQFTSSGYKQAYMKSFVMPDLAILDKTQLSAKELETVLSSWQSEFNIDTGFLWKVGYIHGYGDGSARIFFASHHLIIDTVSWRILLNDLKDLYEGASLPTKTSSYRQWVRAVDDYAKSNQAEIVYWQKQLPDAVANADRSYLNNQKQLGRIVLSEEFTQDLLKNTNAAYQTEINDLLLSALILALKTWTQKDEHAITLEGHGREEINNTIDISGTLGWFTTMYPVKLSAQANLASTIKLTKEILRKIPNKGIAFGALKYSSNSNPLFDKELPSISFNYLGQFDGESEYWKITSENSGKNSLNKDDNQLSLNGWVFDGKLQFNVESYMDKMQHHAFISAFQKNLEEIIIHCKALIQVGRAQYTPSDFNTVALSQPLLDQLQDKYDIEVIYPANSLQQGFIYHALSQPDDDAYRIQMIFDYHQSLDISAYQEAWNRAISQYPTLRTCFNWEEELVQIICRSGKIDWSYYDVSHEQNQEAKILKIQEADRSTGFDLTKPNLLRIHLIKRADEHYTLLKSNHHAISDGWSWPILLNSVHKAYKAILSGKTEEIKIDQAYVKTQEYYSRNNPSITSYWQKKISSIEEANDLNPLLNTSIDLDLVKKITLPKEVDCVILADQYAGLKALLQKEGLTPSALASYAWHKLINSYTGDRQTIVGTTISGRSLPVKGIEDSVGLYINVLPLIIDWSEQSMTVLEKIRMVHKEIMELDSYSYINLVSLQKSGKRLFHSLFVFENYPMPHESDEIKFEFIQAVEKLDYPLTMMGYEVDNCLHFKLKYAGEILDDSQAKRLLSQFQQILQEVSEKLNALDKQVSLINSEEYKTLIFDWNKTDYNHNTEKNLIELFENQVNKTPNAIAVSCANKQLTYQELDQKSNQLARCMRRNYTAVCQQEMKADTPIAIYMARDVEVLISIIAVLKAGGAYVPIDPDYPEERVKFILEDIASPLVLTQSIFFSQLRKINKTLSLIEVDQESYMNESTESLSVLRKSTDLAYIIYTSGTTGKPKGVMLEHRSVINYIDNISRKCLPGYKRVDFSSSLSFDLTVTTTIAALLLGHSIYIYSGRLDNVQAYLEHLKKNSIEFIKMVPALYGLLSKEINASFALREVMLGGEKLNRNNLTYHENIRIYDEYGPTETTVGALLSVIYPEQQPGIGKAYDNYQLYVLDSYLNPVPMGMIGELYIGGVGVARGYLNRPELTTERFIRNPFLMAEEAKAHDNRLYKTGDLVRWLADGNMEYIGRNDFQVKIRGFRIELSEIEKALSEFPGITQSVVLVKQQDENKYLIAYYSSDWAEEDHAIRSYLEEYLPQYMIPSIFIHLESLPLTVNGKVDRKALPDSTLSSKAIYVSPRDEVEEKLCVLWAEILGLPKVGITDDFFKMGGSSILAIKLIHKMIKELNQSISITDLFACKTIVNLKSILNNHTQQIQITKLDTKQAPLSYAQERLWFIERYEGGTNAYNVPMVLELNEKINIAAFKQSLNSLVNRHEILRTVFKQDAFDKDYQLVLNEPLIIEEISIKTDELNKLIKKEVNHLFDLTMQYPIFIKIYKTQDKYYALVNIHHVAFDGWSVDIFLRELTAFYQHYHSGEALNLPVMDIQYKDFAKWQRDYLKGEILEKQVGYWKESLLGYEPLNLMTDKVRPSHIDYKGDNVYFELDERLSHQLKKLAQRKGTTLYTVLLAGFYLFLNKYTRQEDLVIGTPLANRHYTQLENVIGFFINSLALRAKVKNDQSVGELINHVHEVMLNAQKYQDVPFEKLVDALKIGQDSSRHPLFQIMFAVQSFGNLSSENDVFKLLPIGDNYHVAKFDLNIVIDDSHEKFKGVMNYAVSLYEKETIQRFIKHYINILKQIVENENYLLSELYILDESEHQQIVHEWNKSENEYADNKTITTLFEEQVEKNPHSIALVFNDQTLSYQEVNEQSNQLAWYIREQYKNFAGKEIKADTLIAMCVERSFATIIGILAILKAGAAYVPIGANYPDDRIHFMLEDSGCKLVLTQSSLEEKMRSIKDDILVIDLDKTHYKNCSRNNLPAQNQPQDLAYVIYTSGTTGKPKGVMEPHNNVMRLLTATEEEYGFNEKDVWTLFHSYVFDFSVWEIWGALLKGSKLIIPSHEETRDTEKFYDSCEKHGVTVLNQTPLAFYRFTEIALNKQNKLERLRYIIFGGDILQLEKLVPWWNQYGYNQPKLINMYGITETTVHVTYKVLSASDLGFGSNIGRAIKDQKVYVLDEKMNVVPIGVFGELYVGGAGLARGYLNQPELTAERFIPNPFATKEEIAKGHDRLYKSGDIARWHACGELEYIGRNDFQVKLRGFRIELGEIESVLAQFSEVQQSVILVKERDGNKYLIGYYVADKKLDEEAIRFHLSEHLPEYMVPSVLMYLNKLPLTINGKLDRKALPEYDFQLSDDRVVPRTELEKSLCKIWSDVLGISEIGIRDDFFRVGGDSILSIQLVSRLRREGYHCSIKSIFENRTVERLSQYIRLTVDVVTVDAEQGILTGEFNFLPIQQWFFDQRFEAKNHWNQSFLVKVPALETQRLQNLLGKLAQQHDVLRMHYHQNTQVYLEEIIIPELKVLDRSGVTEAELQEILTSWQSGFNIENGPLWQLAYLHGYSDGSARIYFALHHLIVDSVSWRILIEDIKSLYHGEELEKKTSSYRQWVDTVRLYGKKHYQEAFYWQEVIENQMQEYPHVDIEKHETMISLSKALTQDLLQNTSHAYHTQINDLLLTALAYALKSWTGLDENHITLEGHGRENIDDRIEISRTVGWFTSMYPVNLSLEISLADSIKAIKENLRKIPAKGLGYGALKYSCQHPGLVNHQLAPICFNYLGQFDNEQGLWQVIGEASGLSIAANNQYEPLVNINGWVMNGELQFSIVCKLDKNVAKCLSETFKYYLETIITHCMDKINSGEVEHTESDFLSNENTEKLIRENNADELFHFEEEIFNDY